MKYSSLNANYTVTSYLGVKRRALYKKMCYLSRQSKRIKVLFNMVWSQTMKRYSFQWRIYKFNLQKVTSRKCFLSLSTAVFSYDNSIQTLYVANCFKSFTYFKWQRCIASDKFCFLFGPWSKIYICPLLLTLLNITWISAFLSSIS